MEIPGIPESINHNQIRQAFQALDVDPGEVCRVEWQAGAFAVYVEVYGAKRANCSRYWDGWKYDDGDKAAMHRIAIPIVSEPSAEQAGRDFAKTLAAHEGRSEPSTDGTQ
jgi:hypothetical protein